MQASPQFIISMDIALDKVGNYPRYLDCFIPYVLENVSPYSLTDLYQTYLGI